MKEYPSVTVEEYINSFKSEGWPCSIDGNRISVDVRGEYWGTIHYVLADDTYFSRDDILSKQEPEEGHFILEVRGDIILDIVNIGNYAKEVA